MAANILWAHLLRKDATTTTTESPSQIPPIAPLDKSGTSIRLLIHDTQANLEKFSARLDGLLHRVEECKVQVVNANKLLDAERDRVLAEVLEIANRCQADLKTHVGTPAQAHELDLVRVSQISTDKAIQALEKRIDALQVLFQTHTNTMQSLQDQQNNILGAVLPLVPLIQGVPSQIDQIKSALSDMVSSAVSNAVSSMTMSIENVKTTLVHEVTRAQEKRFVRSSTHVGSGSSLKMHSGSLRKRPASSMHNSLDNITYSSPLAGRDPGPSRLSSRKRPHLEGTTHGTENNQLPRKLSRLDIQTIGQHDPLLLPRTPQTPRQPLTDLIPPQPPRSDRPGIHNGLGGNTNAMLYPEYMRRDEAIRSASRSLYPTTGLSLALEPSTVQYRPSVPDSAINGVGPAMLELPIAAEPSETDAISKTIKIEEILQPEFSGVISITSSPLSPAPSSAPQPCLDLSTTRTSPVGTSTQPFLQAPIVMTNGIELLPAPLHPSSNPLPSNSNASPLKPMSLRDRRAQMSRIGRTETRRFIPLVPWSDEEE